MKKQFTTYEIALAVKELGFDEPCFGRWEYEDKITQEGIKFEKTYTSSQTNFSWQIASAPLWQQVIDWLREKHDIDIEIHSKFGQGNGWWSNLCYNPTRTEVLNIAMFDNYYDAREQGILKAIELCQKK